MSVVWHDVILNELVTAGHTIENEVGFVQKWHFNPAFELMTLRDLAQ